jgi:hypothetical protein
MRRALMYLYCEPHFNPLLEGSPIFAFHHASTGLKSASATARVIKSSADFIAHQNNKISLAPWVLFLASLPTSIFLLGSLFKERSRVAHSSYKIFMRSQSGVIFT